MSQDFWQCGHTKGPTATTVVVSGASVDAAGSGGGGLAGRSTGTSADGCERKVTPRASASDSGIGGWAVDCASIPVREMLIPRVFKRKNKWVGRFLSTKGRLEGAAKCHPRKRNL